MRKTILGFIPTFFLCSAFSVLKQNQPEKTKVSGTVMRVKAHCGGARMTEEMYNEFSKPIFYANKKLFIKKGKWNDLKKKPILEFISDSTGNFSFSLPPGEYCIVDEYKNDKTNYNKLLNKFKEPTLHYSAISSSCLKEWFKTPAAVLNIPSSGLNNFVITFYDECSWNKVPCATYHGPLPP